MAKLWDYIRHILFGENDTNVNYVQISPNCLIINLYSVNL
jgi:hypothetical protein